MVVLINWDAPALYVVYLLLGFGLIGLVSYLCYKFIPGLRSTKDSDETMDEKKIAEEELKRILVPIDEEETEIEKEEEKPSNEPEVKETPSDDEESK